MKYTTACIVSDDASFQDELEKVLAEQLDLSVVTTSVEEWLRHGVTRSNRPDIIFFDFRADGPETEKLWDDLPHVGKRVHELAGTSVTSIGVVDQGFPIQHAKKADHWLAGSIFWPLNHKSIQAVVERASQQWHETDLSCRVVKTANHEFRTYSPALFAMLEKVEMAARHDDFTILIVGETGTGKTTLAAMIHELSSREDERFLTVACGALPGDLIDSELFGHEKGSFTSADRTKPGKFEAAENGTILLDEIDVLGLIQQAKLLRVLETGEYEPVGSNETKLAKCRTIVASNVSLESLIESRQFRSDLFFRLNQVKFEIPPLRDRPLDIAPLAVDFIDQCCHESDQHVTHIHPDLLFILKSYSWPGNIRQLRNEVRRAVLFSKDGIVSPQPLSLDILEEVEASRATEAESEATSVLAREVALTERESIEQMLERHKYNRAATARALGISRVTLYNKLRKYRVGAKPKDQG